VLNLNQKLRELEASGRPIRVGVVGAGQMGTGLIAQINQLRGMRVVAVADIDLSRARRALDLAGIEKAIVTDHALSLARALEVDVVVEATGLPEIGAEVALAAIEGKKHVVMLNAEADVTVGHLLARKAKEAGVIYTGSAGDEPAAAKELYDFADALGFEILVAGKGKNNPLRQTAVPADLAAEAKAKNMNPKMLCSFVDGTKTMVEMTCLANATGLTIDRVGMHGVEAGLSEVVGKLRLEAEGGVLGRYGVVEFVNGIAPGVFVIVRTRQEVVLETMRYLKMGDGPNFLLYRPYHLTSLETPISAARAVIYNEPTIVSQGAPVAETVAVAKRTLDATDKLDGLGNTTVYGTILTAAGARNSGALPLGLAINGTRLRRKVAAGQVLTYDDVDLPDLPIVALRREQDALFALTGFLLM
jgi:predicted homoserine dehydrogenase-like protein